MTAKERQLLELDILLYFEYLYQIPKSELLDNEVYYPAYYSNKRYNLIWGGRGSGKSYDIEGKLPIVLTSCLPFCRILMIRQVYDSIKGSQFQEVKDYIEKWGLQSEYKVTTSPMEIKHLKTGNFIKFAGMDKPDSLKSVKDITHAIFGEAFQIKSEEGVDKVDKSIRTPLIDQTKLFFVFNPDNKSHFLYGKFFDQDREQEYSYYRENMLSINTTHWNNKFVPLHFRKLIEKDKEAHPERYKVDALGQWGDLKKLNAYYINFQSELQVSKIAAKYDPNRDLHISFDFNVYPYITLEIKQVFETESELQVFHVGEICLNEKQHGADKVGNIQHTIKEFLNRYKGHKGTVHVYGDRSGHNKKTNALSDYATIFAMLKPTPRAMFIGGTIDPYPEYTELGCTFSVRDMTNKTQNPRHDARKLFFRRLHAGTLSVLPLSRTTGTINAAGHKRPLSERHGGKKIVQLIDVECKFLISDYSNVEESESGGKDERNKNLTHTSDAVDYFFCSYFDVEFKQVESELKR